MKHTLNTIFLEDTLNLINKKYLNNISFSNEKLFSYANIFDYPLYYKLFTFSKDADFGLYNKFQKQKQFEVIELFSKKIAEDKYNSDDLLLLYSYICSIILNFYLDEYIYGTTKFLKLSSKKMKMNKYSKIIKKIEAQIYKERFYKSIKKQKLNIKEIKIEDNSLKLINEVSSKIYYFSYGIDIFNNGFKNFVCYQKRKTSCFKLINHFAASILDAITRSKKYSASSIYYTYTPIKKDFLNKENKIWIKKECYKSFYEIYEEAALLASKLITIVSDEIFYKVKRTNEIKYILGKIKE